MYISKMTVMNGLTLRMGRVMASLCRALPALYCRPPTFCHLPTSSGLQPLQPVIHRRQYHQHLLRCLRSLLLTATKGDTRHAPLGADGSCRFPWPSRNAVCWVCWVCWFASCQLPDAPFRGRMGSADNSPCLKQATFEPHCRVKGRR
jgi:hypothetical protein